MNILKKGFAELKEIFFRIKRKDFSGYKGMAVKNNLFQTSTALVAKGGSFIFTIVLARILMPELFGLYSLALSTIVLFSAFSNPGIFEALVRFVSKELGRNKKEKAKAYALYLGKLKILLVLISISVLIVSARFISDVYYSKPIFLGLIAGALYIIFLRISSFMHTIIQSSNYFEADLYNEILFQIFRFALVPLAAILALKYGFNSETVVFSIIIALSLVYLISSLFLTLIVKKKLFFFKIKPSKLSKKEKKKTNKFLVAVSAAIFSGLFFETIDMLMLGHFVSADFIGYYTVGVVMISALVPLITFAGPLLPIFSRISKKRASSAMDKSARLTFFSSLIFLIPIILLAPVIILVFYGESYAPSINILRLSSLTLISIPLIALYRSYFISIGKPEVISKVLFFSIFLNLGLNYFLITSLLNYGQLPAVFGAVIATIISRYFLLFVLIFKKRKLK
jgi:O-antigen/teichoic acid export membrane protein